MKKTLDVVIEFRVDDAILIDRISGRFACAKCGAGYHDRAKRPVVDGVCDRCGSTEFIRRKDDNAETVRNRLMAYYRETSPLIGYYFAKGKLATVDGMAPIVEVTNQIEEILNKKKRKAQSAGTAVCPLQRRVTADVRVTAKRHALKTRTLRFGHGGVSQHGLEGIIAAQVGICTF